MKFLHWFGIPVVMAIFMTTSAMALSISELDSDIDGAILRSCYKPFGNLSNGLACSSPNDTLQPGDWRTSFSYGNVYGASWCSDVSGTYPMAADSATNNILETEYNNWTPTGTTNDGVTGQHCWCRIESIDGHEAVSNWVYKLSTGSCYNSCSNNCANTFNNETNFRRAMFRTSVPGCLAVSFDDTTNGGTSPDPQNPTIYRKTLAPSGWYSDPNCENAYTNEEMRSLLHAPEPGSLELRFAGYFINGEEIFHNQSSYAVPNDTTWTPKEGESTLLAQYECDRTQGLVLDMESKKCVFGVSVFGECQGDTLSEFTTLNQGQTLSFSDVVNYNTQTCNKTPCAEVGDEYGFDIYVYDASKEKFFGPTTNSPMTSGVITGGDSYVVNGTTYTSPYQILLRPNCDPKINIHYFCGTDHGDGASGIQGTPGASYTTLTAADSGCEWNGHNIAEWRYPTGDESSPYATVTPGSNITLPRNMAELTLTAVWAGANIICEPGYFLPAGGSRCKICTDDHYCPGGEFPLEPEKDEGLNPCPEKLRSGAGQDEIGDCGRILHVENCINGECSGPYVYLRSNKKTMPSLNVEIEGKVYYGNMFMVGNGVDGLIKTEYNGSTYVVCDETDRDICTGIGANRVVFDTSINGICYYSHGLNGSSFLDVARCEGEDISRSEWKVLFNYGAAVGKSWCSDIGFTFFNDRTNAQLETQYNNWIPTDASPYGVSGRYCWCRIDNVNSVSTVSNWTPNGAYSDSYECASRCGNSCANKFKEETEFRTEVFGEYAQQ
ncbi:MAG: hypothetical protein J6T57_01315 [Alphaproteobacteria bacterium]|nr:hypothetical protein [Alphaproteobacteria bacterium]